MTTDPPRPPRHPAAPAPDPRGGYSLPAKPKSELPEPPSGPLGTPVLPGVPPDPPEPPYRAAAPDAAGLPDHDRPEPDGGPVGQNQGAALPRRDQRPGEESLTGFVSTPTRGTPIEAAGHPADEESAGMRIPMPAQTGPEADRLRYVGAATRRIARGVDLDEILLGLCRSAVPAFADAILVYLREPLPVGDERPSGPLRLRLRRSDGGLEGPSEADDDAPVGATPLLPALLPTMEPSYGGTGDSIGVLLDGPLAEVLRGVRPVFADSIRAADALAELLGRGDDPIGLPTGRRALLAPLRGRRRVIGAAVLLRRAGRAPFESDDLLVAAQLATHTALGVDKAVLYGREAYIADALQREMLPDSLPQPTGVQLASRYLPAAESARVGGDWYDAIPLPGSRVALVVGDVMGHSMTSAAIMGQLRTTVQTLAGLDLAPQEVLYHLDEQAQRLGQDRMATCVYAVYDPIAHRLVVANAGHPPPVLLHADGLAEVLRVPPGAPIGVGGVPFEAVELPAPAGATLLLYTDGLVESRSRDVWGGIELLRERLHDAASVVSPPPLEPLCDEVLEILGPGDRDDDIALLAARFDGIAPSDVAYWFLEPQAQTPGRARRLVRQALRRWDLEDQLEAAELLVSEIVTNAVRYAERPITLRLLRTDVLRCEVGDDAPLLPRMRHAAPEEEGGRGLYLVNRMAQRWGATRLGAGKVVWFELPL
ncbi:ATP-binding SpoIIE family protein phosphatase [Actinacidiphila paucisporea]|uniref:protein-serine/threonine phosphatase n=1 Tax=Actinacidiphila paucisporea TaxID=310782 RepID=A0A1M6UJF2_9ACTN|nr:SpoIIE family protein phosphatase [Actinacidiphila paucisporea]SHK69307.1 Serine phosphatase RsbU, regulator of sigma subunit [Actinacidiphila paucisporea]